MDHHKPDSMFGKESIYINLEVLAFTIVLLLFKTYKLKQRFSNKKYNVFIMGVRTFVFSSKK